MVQKLTAPHDTTAPGTEAILKGSMRANTQGRAHGDRSKGHDSKHVRLDQAGRDTGNDGSIPESHVRACNSLHVLMSYHCLSLDMNSMKIHCISKVRQEI